MPQLSQFSCITMKVPVILLAFFITLTSAAYIPGSPGVPWSVETQKAVKAKLYKIFSPHQSLALYRDLHNEGESFTYNEVNVLFNGEVIKQKWESMPNTAKVLRLGFHSCFP